MMEMGEFLKHLQQQKHMREAIEQARKDAESNLVSGNNFFSYISKHVFKMYQSIYICRSIPK